MCTYVTEKAELFGSGKGPLGWFRVDMANVYFDHPVHAPLDHSLNIDFVNEAAGSPTRVAVGEPAPLLRWQTYNLSYPGRLQYVLH